MLKRRKNKLKIKGYLHWIFCSFLCDKWKIKRVSFALIRLILNRYQYIYKNYEFLWFFCYCKNRVFDVKKCYDWLLKQTCWQFCVSVSNWVCWQIEYAYCIWIIRWKYSLFQLNWFRIYLQYEKKLIEMNIHIIF